MKKRVYTAAIMTIILIGVCLIPNFYGDFIFSLLFLVLALLGGIEIINCFSKEKRFSTLVTFIILLGITALVATNDIDRIGYNVNTYLSIAIIVMVFISLILLVFVKDYDAKDASKTIFSILYIGLGFFSIIFLRLQSLSLIIYAFLISMTTDVAAQLFGIKFGRHKMIPRISPKKSWEGAIAGTVISTLVSGTFAIFIGVIFKSDNYFTTLINKEHYDTILGYFGIGSIPYYAQVIIIYSISLVGSVVSQIGDLVASKIKRTYDIKDFGNILPGHGGILDRFDSLILLSIFLVILYNILILI
ncbi:MAG: phosphatidate cytidylyltransferase [Acholeplasmatales bacterium]|jgi:phosphatidate cytidylyltransferase|nr:phosphatidate cytidylyltransferase [Acholeplasmatales bacterium]